MKICSIEDCGKPSKARGWCWTHYGRWKVHGSTAQPVRVPKHSPVCTVTDCEAKSVAGGICDMHYRRVKAHGSTDLPERTPRPQRECSVDDCNRKHCAKGYCELHYRRWRKHGSTDVPKRKTGADHDNWRGGDVSYTALHSRLGRARGSASEQDCSECSGRAAEWAYDFSDPSPLYAKRRGLYSADLSRYRPMCVPCHKAFDAPRGTRRKVAA